MIRSLHPWGLIAAAIMFALGLTPSLLPRDGFYQGLVSGVAAGLGYGIGVVVHWLWCRYGAGRAKRRPVLEKILTGLVVLVLLGVVLFARPWQVGLAERTGAPAGTWGSYLLILPVGISLFLAVVAAGRLLRAQSRWLQRKLPERLAPSLRSVTSWAAVIVLVVFVVNQVIPGAMVAGAERVFSVRLREPEAGKVTPTEAERSGSPESHVEWAGVGTYGARYLNQGLDRAGLEELTGRAAREPIRLYAGLGNAPTDSERAQLIIDELERTDAADRKAILLVMTTGTGWVAHNTVQGFELLYGGDTAIVAEQYSSLPSAYHYLAGGSLVRQAGREFITPIVDWWNELPDEDRPGLFLYGESLGTTGVESAFSGIRDIANSVDGILLAGPPQFNPLWSSFVERRDPGSPEVRPEYSGGMVVRFANDKEQITELLDDPASWGPTRLLYLQHASDPVVWWSPELLLKRPDWLVEPAGPDRLPEMTWLPLVTFLQVSADLPVSQNAHEGSGHNYGRDTLAGFAAIAKRGSFSAEDVSRLEPLLPEAIRMTGDDVYN